MMFIYNFNDWNSLLEGVDFKDNFTPLYHLTPRLVEILQGDTLKISGKQSRGPAGICVTRSKFFEHDDNLDTSFISCRIILNYELLKRHGYKTYPVDEWSLNKNPKSREEWLNKSLNKKKHLGKSYFPAIKKGIRKISHNIPSLPDKYSPDIGLEVEFEERILKEIKNLGRFIYGINFINMNAIKKFIDYSTNKNLLVNYLEKYPHIKIYIGKFFLKEIKIEDIIS